MSAICHSIDISIKQVFHKVLINKLKGGAKKLFTVLLLHTLFPAPSLRSHYHGHILAKYLAFHIIPGYNF